MNKQIWFITGAGRQLNRDSPFPGAYAGVLRAIALATDRASMPIWRSNPVGTFRNPTK
jgi:hypothetical protein